MERTYHFQRLFDDIGKWLKYAAPDQLYIVICKRISGWYNELEDRTGVLKELGIHNQP